MKKLYRVYRNVLFVITTTFIMLLTTAFNPVASNLGLYHLINIESSPIRKIEEGLRLNPELNSEFNSELNSELNQELNYEITERSFLEIRNDAEITAIIPVVTMQNKEFEGKLNDLIKQKYEDALDLAVERQTRINVTYEVIVYDKYTSILLTREVVSGTNSISVRSVNFNNKTLELIDINSVLGSNGVKLVNKAVSREVSSNIEKYKANFSGIESNHTFYVDDGILQVVFDKADISHGYMGVIHFPIEINNIITTVISDYRIKTAYNTRMIMLKQIADAFGIILEWNEKTYSVGIYSQDNQFITEIMIGKNAYYKDRGVPMKLEAAPEIEDGRTFVPVSFFEEILGISYSVGSDGAITFSKYVANQ